MRKFLVILGVVIIVLYGRHRFSEDYCPTHFMNMASGSNDLPSIGWVAASKAELNGTAPFTTKLKYQLSLPHQEKSCIYMSKVRIAVDFADGENQVVFDPDKRIGPSEDLVLRGNIIQVEHTWRRPGRYETKITASATRAKDGKTVQLLQTSSPTIVVLPR